MLSISRTTNQTTCYRRLAFDFQTRHRPKIDNARIGIRRSHTVGLAENNGTTAGGWWPVENPRPARNERSRAERASCYHRAVDARSRYATSEREGRIYLLTPILCSPPAGMLATLATQLFSPDSGLILCTCSLARVHHETSV